MTSKEMSRCERIKMQAIFKGKKLAYFPVQAGNEEFVAVRCFPKRAADKDAELHPSQQDDLVRM